MNKKDNMRILYVLDSPHEFQNGCWFDRLHQPGQKLAEMGHEVKTFIMGMQTPKKWIGWADIVIFTRYYKRIPMTFMRRLKEGGAKIVYEIDDNTFKVPSVNPTKKTSDEKKELVEKMLRNVDLVTTTTKVLAKVLKEHGADNVKICPNAVDFKRFEARENKKGLRIGWSGSVTHFHDLMEVLPAIRDLQKKYDFEFILQGICSQPFLAEIYNYNFYLKLGVMKAHEVFFKKGLEVFEMLKDINYRHVPFYPPEMHPRILKDIDLDIGLCPLIDDEFNRSKSANKFYQYAAVETPTIASHVTPYKEEVNYTVKKDWYSKIEKMIKSEKLREETLKKQIRWVDKNRNLKTEKKTWEKALQSLIK